MNILIIEDDQNFARNLHSAFLRQELVNRVMIIDSPENFYTYFSILDQYDIILVDLTFQGDTLGQPSGYKCIKSIREAYIDIPIIVISGHEQIDMMERAFILGATDYINKNIRLSEIQIRVIHWFRLYCLRVLQNRINIVSYHGLEYNTETNIFIYNGVHVVLSKGNKYILGLLLMHAEKVLSENYLTEKIWGDYEEGASERNLRVTIARLRKALEPYGLSNWIESIYREGYVLRWKDEKIIRV